MTYNGTVKNGVVVFDGGGPRPAEGTAVRVEPVPTLAGVYKNPRDSGGDACDGDTRIPVWTLVAYRDLGRSDGDLLRDFPSLTAANIKASLIYTSPIPRDA
jgi:uncharacterized protein (DUF433 family)